MRCHPSFWSARLPKPKVAGSTPVVRFSSSQTRLVDEECDPEDDTVTAEGLRDGKQVGTGLHWNVDFAGPR
jgi:hypothetical protein